LEMRPAGATNPMGFPTHPFWVRTKGRLPDDPLLHACALTFISDTATVLAVRAAHPRGDVPPERHNEVFMGASLDHAVWFHHPAKADDWLLMDNMCHFVGGARGLSFGHVFDRSGRHVASIAQEVLLRRADDGVVVSPDMVPDDS